CFFFFQAEDGIRDGHVTGVQTCALPISSSPSSRSLAEMVATSTTCSGLSIGLLIFLSSVTIALTALSIPVRMLVALEPAVTLRKIGRASCRKEGRWGGVEDG